GRGGRAAGGSRAATSALARAILLLALRPSAPDLSARFPVTSPPANTPDTFSSASSPSPNFRRPRNCRVLRLGVRLARVALSEICPRTVSKMPLPNGLADQFHASPPLAPLAAAIKAVRSMVSPSSAPSNRLGQSSEAVSLPRILQFATTAEISSATICLPSDVTRVVNAIGRLL